ncbi:EAL domain-containing protein [Endozoicomonas numazuensis]|uniref:EAL domain-containing protein n=1 Tax=Endozoicomonas numazuensis TaxID=1137799 RepID=UPI00068A0B69|nr:EAL domain-containing protein [Endozoicomonas numazuensis]
MGIHSQEQKKHIRFPAREVPAYTLKTTDTEPWVSSASRSSVKGYKQVVAASLICLIGMFYAFPASLIPLHLLEWATCFALFSLLTTPPSWLSFKWIRTADNMILKALGLGLFTGLAPVWTLSLLTTQQLFIIPLILVSLSAFASHAFSGKAINAIAYSLGLIIPFSGFFLLNQEMLDPLWFIGWFLALGLIFSASLLRSENTDGISKIDSTHLKKDLAVAIRNHSLEVHYQPRYQFKHQKIIKVEALVRWHHQEQGYIEPEQIISLAEELGLIHELGHLVLTAACQQLQQWQKQGIDLQVSVNLSVSQLMNEDLHDAVTATLKQTGIKTTHLEFELTESQPITSMNRAVEKLNTFKQLGIKISLDDFGSGYATHYSLSELPLDTLKIDRSLILNLATDKKCQAITESSITMAHKLGMSMVAEGVEDAQTLALLRSYHCDEVQGNFICPALSSTELTPILLKGISI